MPTETDKIQEFEFIINLVYSLAFYLSEHFPLGSGWDWHVHATDISTKVLAKARQGIYPADRLNSLPPESEAVI